MAVDSQSGAGGKEAILKVSPLSSQSLFLPLSYICVWNSTFWELVSAGPDSLALPECGAD